MEPENPSRRSKPGQEPLTIDLEATKPPEDERATAGSDAAVPGETADQAQAVNETPDSPAHQPDDSTVADPFKTASMANDDLAGRNTDEEQEARAQAAAAAFAEKPRTATPEETHRAASPAQDRPSTSSALAAGIVGGLVTLLAAGGLQYAGVLPAFGPDRISAVEQSLVADMDALKAQLAALPAPSAAVDLVPMETRIAELESKSAETGNSTATEISDLEAQLTNLTNEIATLKSNIADTQVSAEAAKSELSTRLEAAEKKIEEPASDVQLARAIAVTALKTAVDRGGPFLAELDALKSISPDDPAVAGLAGDAATGVAPRADLVRDFPSTADAMIEATRHTDPDQGIFSRLMDSASSAIRVRPVGSIEGDTPEAIVARIEDKLTNGDLKGASLEWETLPDPAKAAGADFKSKLDQRVRIEGVIDTTVAGAMTAKG